MNVVSLTGRLTKDPERSNTSAGATLCRMRLAVETPRSEEPAIFIDVSCFGKQAQAAGAYLKKGELVAVTGRLDFSRWTGSDGQERSKHSVAVRSIDFLEKRLGRAKPTNGDAPVAAEGPTLVGQAHG